MQEQRRAQLRLGLRMTLEAAGERGFRPEGDELAGHRSLDVLQTRTESRIIRNAADVESVAVRLPRNYEFAGKEYPRELRTARG